MAPSVPAPKHLFTFSAESVTTNRLTCIDLTRQSLSTNAFIRTNASLLGPRLRRHKTCEAVVHNELAVVFSAMLDDAVCNVENARFLARVINNLRRQAFVASRLDGGRAIGEGFLDERNDVGLGLVLVAPGIFCCLLRLPHDGIGEEIVRSCRVQQLLCEAAFARRGLEVVFVLRKIL